MVPSERSCLLMKYISVALLYPIKFPTKETSKTQPLIFHVNNFQGLRVREQSDLAPH